MYKLLEAIAQNLEKENAILHEIRSSLPQAC